MFQWQQESIDILGVEASYNSETDRWEVPIHGTESGGEYVLKCLANSILQVEKFDVTELMRLSVDTRARAIQALMRMMQS